MPRRTFRQLEKEIEKHLSDIGNRRVSIHAVASAIGSTWLTARRHLERMCRRRKIERFEIAAVRYRLRQRQ